MRKEFKLNDRQSITIDDSHPLYQDILIAVLSEQDIDPIVKDILIKNGYRYGINYWHHAPEAVSTDFASDFPIH